MVDEVGVASTSDGLGTHADTCATGACGAFVGQYFGREHAEELFLRIGVLFSKTLT